MPRRTKMQRRGKGKPKYRAPSHKYLARVRFPPIREELMVGEVVEILHDPARTAPLMIIRCDDDFYALPAPEGIMVGSQVEIGSGAHLRAGNVLPLGEIPEGMDIFNIELVPGDGGKIVRAAGLSAKVMAKEEGRVIVKLPSRQLKVLNPRCRAMIGVVAGAGRKEKPLLKAGKVYHILKAKAKVWPRVAARAMNPVDHPMGGGKRRHKRKKTTSKRAPRGARVGSIGARRTGRKKGGKK